MTTVIFNGVYFRENEFQCRWPSVLTIPPVLSFLPFQVLGKLCYSHWFIWRCKRCGPSDKPVPNPLELYVLTLLCGIPKPVSSLPKCSLTEENKARPIAALHLAVREWRDIKQKASCSPVPDQSLCLVKKEPSQLPDHTLFSSFFQTAGAQLKFWKQVLSFLCGGCQGI